MLQVDPRALAALSLCALAAPAAAQGEYPAEAITQEPIGVPLEGERLPTSAIGPILIETLAESEARAASTYDHPPYNPKMRNGRPGEWRIPSQRAMSTPHSGDKYATNKWGDPRMGISFGEPVDLAGAWLAGHSGRGAWPRNLQFVGYRGGEEVARSAILWDVGAQPVWLQADLAGVDRVELVGTPNVGGVGFFALDDLTFVRGGAEVVLDFEDLPFRGKLHRSGYGGLEWETGTGPVPSGVPFIDPPVPAGDRDEAADEPFGTTQALGGGGTAPTEGIDFVGPRFGDTGAGFIPPDTCGAVGPNHFIAIVNANFSVYNKSNGVRISSQSLNNFWGSGGTKGDPRIAYDDHAGRWVAICTDFNTRIYIAYSSTSDPTGSWLKTFYVASSGADSGRFPDYPTLGVDQNGVYVGASMFGGSSAATLWAIDKAPLLGGSLGAITAFRGLALEGAIQPCVTYGTPSGEYCVSRTGSTSIRVRRVNPPLASPTLSNLGFVSTPSGGSPPNAPASGSGTNLDTVGSRLMNAVYRNGSIWTTNCISSGGRAACRWYEIDAGTLTTNQVGTVNDPTLHYFMPSIAVNANDDVVLGFSGSSAAQFAGAYYAGRFSSDMAGQMSTPVEFKNGQGAYNNLDGFGRNRWGDYSLTSVDPVDDDTIWTIQEYARTGNSWGTWIQELELGGGGTGCATPPSTYCVTTPNSVGSGALIGFAGTGSIAANNLTLLASGCPPAKSGVFFYGPNAISPVPFGDGQRCVGGGLTRIGPLLTTSASGDVVRSLDLTQSPFTTSQNPVLPGLTYYFQFWYRDLAGPGSAGTNLTDGLEVPFCP